MDPHGSQEESQRPLDSVIHSRFHLVQLNMHHAKLASFELYPQIGGNRLACVQVPWIVKGHPKGLLANLRGIYKPDPKAAIIYHKDSDVTPLQHLTTQLMATAILRTTRGRMNSKILISSWYWPQDTLPTGIHESG